MKHALEPVRILVTLRNDVIEVTGLEDAGDAVRFVFEALRMLRFELDGRDLSLRIARGERLDPRTVRVRLYLRVMGSLTIEQQLEVLRLGDGFRELVDLARPRFGGPDVARITIVDERSRKLEFCPPLPAFA